MIARAQRRPSSAAGTADTENLHTDVMRFMAILGLCLAAIFALVQSVPSHEADRDPPEQPLNDAADRVQREALRAEIERLTTLVGEVREENDRTEQALAEARTQLAAANSETARSQRERTRLASRLQELTRKLRRERSALQHARETAQAKAEALSAPARETDEQRTYRKPAQPAPAPFTQPRQTPATPHHELPSDATQRGFTLRFASAEALAHLVRQNRVVLYAMSGKKAWRMSLPQGRPRFTPHDSPGRFHEMTPATVPPAYVRALAGTPGTPSTGTVVWGVRLPPEIERAIADLARGRNGGDLVIGTSGQLYLNEQASNAQRRAR